MSILLRNICYPDKDFSSWTSGNVLLSGTKISYVGSELRDADEVLDCSGKIVVPGFVNCHAHSYTGYLKGTIDNVPLDIYMLYAIAGGSCRSEREIYVCSALEALTMLKFGTTAVVDHFSQRPCISAAGLDATAKAFKDVGIRGKIAAMFADKGFLDTLPLRPGELPKEVLPSGGAKPQSVDEYIAIVEEAYLKYSGDPLVSIMLGTDGPQRCSDELLLKTGELEAKYRMGWQTHILEAKTQALVSRAMYGKGLIEHMDELGIINDRTALVHHVWVSDRELELVGRHRSTVVHCPGSNLHLGSGVAPIDKYIDAGADIALGSDGSNCGDVSMLGQIKLAASLHNVSRPDYERWFSAADALRMDYEGGAKIFAEDIGAVKEGAQADLTIIDIDNIFWQPVNDITRQLVYYENGANIDRVFVAGRKVLEHGKSTLLDERAIMEEASAICEKLRRDCAPACALADKQAAYLRNMYMREIEKDIGYNRFIREI